MRQKSNSTPASSIVIGVLQLYAAIRLWNVIDNDWWLILGSTR
jgi:hypothetical protein